MRTTRLSWSDATEPGAALCGSRRGSELVGILVVTASAAAGSELATLPGLTSEITSRDLASRWLGRRVLPGGGGGDEPVLFRRLGNEGDICVAAAQRDGG